MTTVQTRMTDEAICSAAVEKYGCADANVARQHVHGNNAIDAGDWFVLAIRPTSASEWHVVARRRTKLELWYLVRG